ncbi:hypothetical protein [Saccharospirillum alexandrii]|uniref:hypothetical protein n=1 Tax=Saccharospirillum alexandrii TaxID=2448477 RepID=UPI000FDCDC65|nr:hypothetical protein [Saccharospirillum alexandrii]
MSEQYTANRLNVENGFSLVELVVIVLLISILSAVTLPRLFNLSSFNDAGTRTHLESALTFTRNRATTTQCTLEFRITTTGWSVWQDDDCQSTGSSGAGCAAPLNFITAVAAPGETTQLTGTLTSTTLERLFFTPTGRLYRYNTTGDCTSLPANLVPSGTQIVGLTPTTTLRLDGVTGYVAVQ